MPVSPTFAVLHYLIENAGRLLSEAELPGSVSADTFLQDRFRKSAFSRYGTRETALLEMRHRSGPRSPDWLRPTGAR